MPRLRFQRPAKKGGDSSDDEAWVPPQKKHRNQPDSAVAASPSDAIDTLLAKCSTIPSSITAHLVAPDGIEQQHGLLQPKGITNGKLKLFQLAGVHWMAHRVFKDKVGVLLCDDLGCGKTVQTIATLECIVEHATATSAPYPTALIICPLSVVQTWVDEFKHFASSRRVLKFTGSKEERDGIIGTIEGLNTSCPLSEQASISSLYDVVISTPEILLSDVFFFSKVSFRALVIDEAHRFRNVKGKLHRVVLNQFNASIQYRLLLTGTPYHNSPLELWALLRLANPEILGNIDIEDVVEDCKQCATKASNSTGSLAIPDWSVKATSTIILRRMKKDVLKGIPPLKEVVLEAPMSPLQHRLYRALLRKDVASVISPESGGKGRLMNLVMQLRQCTNHPYMFNGVEPEPFQIGEHLVNASGKLLCLDKLLRQLHHDGHRVLIFSQFTDMLDILQDFLVFRKYEHERLDGSVRGDDRTTAIQSFQRDQEVFVMLLSTRAGGVGITLTGADTVIFFDSDWNPQMDLQAQQRAHRIGQTRSVTVYRIVCSGTVESVILQRAARKLKAAADALGDSVGAAAAVNVDKEALKEVLQLGAGLLKDAPTTDEWTKFVEMTSVEALLAAAQRVDFSAVGETISPAVAKKVFNQEAVNSSVEPSVYTYGDVDYGDEVRKGGAKRLKDMLDYVPNFKEEAEADKLIGRIPKALQAPLMEGRRHTVVDGSMQEEGYWEGAEGTMMLRGEKRKKLSDRERILKLLPGWRRAGYVSFSVPLDEDLYPSAKGQANKDKLDDDSDLIVGDTPKPSLRHVVGDMFKPQSACTHAVEGSEELPVVIVPISNRGKWGRGALFGAAAATFPNAPTVYENAKVQNDMRLGDVYFLRQEPRTGRSPMALALCVVQRDSTSSYHSGGDIDSKALDLAFRRLHQLAAHHGKVLSLGETHSSVENNNDDDNDKCDAEMEFGLLHPTQGVGKTLQLSFHLPQIGSRGDDISYAAEKLAARYLGFPGCPASKYYQPRRTFHAAASPLSASGSLVENTSSAVADWAVDTSERIMEKRAQKAAALEAKKKKQEQRSKAETAEEEPVPRLSHREALAVEPPRYEQLSSGSFCFVGFEKDPNLLKKLQRLVLLHGGVIVSLASIKPEDAGENGLGKPVIVMPPIEPSRTNSSNCKGHPKRQQSGDVPDEVVALHEAGVPVVDPDWLYRRIAAA